MLFYRLLSVLAPMVLRLVAMFRPTVRKSLSARSNWRSETERLARIVDRPVIFHCASLGEFDQALPLIQRVKDRYAELPLIVSFF